MTEIVLQCKERPKRNDTETQIVKVKEREREREY
jgi:hypothetical protein